MKRFRAEGIGRTVLSSAERRAAGSKNGAQTAATVALDCNPAVDKLIDRQSIETDPEQRKQLVWEIEIGSGSRFGSNSSKNRRRALTGNQRCSVAIEQFCIRMAGCHDDRPAGRNPARLFNHPPAYQTQTIDWPSPCPLIAMCACESLSGHPTS